MGRIRGADPFFWDSPVADYFIFKIKLLHATDGRRRPGAIEYFWLGIVGPYNGIKRPFRNWHPIRGRFTIGLLMAVIDSQ
jgi:hypothetical protein